MGGCFRIVRSAWCVSTVGSKPARTQALTIHTPHCVAVNAHAACPLQPHKDAIGGIQQAVNMIGARLMIRCMIRTAVYMLQ